MSISRRGLLAAGLAVAVVGTMGVVSTMNAGADETPAAPAAVAAPTPPPVLPWGAKPHPIRKGARGASSRALAKAGASAADNPLATGSVTEFGPKGERGLKSSRTSVPPMPRAKAAADKDVHYLYATGRQDTSPDSVAALMTVSAPKVAAADWHSLAEVTMESADEQQIVEVGWNVDRTTNGDDNTHLFVYHWVNGESTCYNKCDFTSYSGASIVPGATLATGAVKEFGIQHYNGAWWVAYDSEFIGYFADSVWKGTYTKAGVVQVFGEVALSGTATCTQMGNGAVASDSSSSKISSVTYTNGPAVQLKMTADAPYSFSAVSDRTFHYGGPSSSC